MPNGNPTKELLKIGQLAQLVGVLPSKINYYTNEGLLPASTRSKGGYRLYEKDKTIKSIQKIQKLQNRRLTIVEIKEIIINKKSVNQILGI